MTVALSSLRVVTDGDSSGYVKSMADVERSSDSATDAVNKFTDAQGNQATYTARTVDALGNASSRYERLARSLDPAYASSVKLSQAQTTLQSALDRGAVSTDRFNQLRSGSAALARARPPSRRSSAALAGSSWRLRLARGRSVLHLLGWGRSVSSRRPASALRVLPSIT